MKIILRRYKENAVRKRLEVEVISCKQRERDSEHEEQWKENECREKTKLDKHGEKEKVSSDLVKCDFSDSSLFFSSITELLSMAINPSILFYGSLDGVTGQ